MQHPNTSEKAMNENITTHTLKTWPESFEAIVTGVKRYEIRKADRPYSVGDHLLLQEWSPETETYSGRQVCVVVSYMTRGGEWGLPPDIVVMSITIEEKGAEKSPDDEEPSTFPRSLWEIPKYTT